MSFYLSNRSRRRLEGVHPDLIRIVERAITLTAIDFGVTEGLRTKERQKELVARGASKTMHSRHLTGHAVDLVAYIGTGICWDWPLYNKIADAMCKAAEELDIPLEWGGNWTHFKDGPHFQLPWRNYPADAA